MLGCDSIINPAGEIPSDHSITLNFFVVDSGFSCPEKSALNDTQSLQQLCFDLLPDTDDNAAVAPVPVLSVLTLLTENASDKALMGLRSKIPLCFLDVESAIQQKSPWYGDINLESVFWGQSGYLFSTNFLNTISLCDGIRLKTVDFVRSGDVFYYTLSGYFHSLSRAFDTLSFSVPENIDSVRGVFTSAFYINTLFDSSAIADTNYEGIFQDISDKFVVSKGIKFKKVLDTYQDSSLIVYNVALKDTSLLMYVFTAINDSFKHALEELMNKKMSFHPDTINQLWLPFVSIYSQPDDFNNFQLPINDTTVDYSYINNNGALKISGASTSVFFSLSYSLTVASNATLWLNATRKENKNNWGTFYCGNTVMYRISMPCPDTIPDRRPFSIALIHRKTNSVVSIASINKVNGIPLCQ